MKRFGESKILFKHSKQEGKKARKTLPVAKESWGK